MDAGHKSSNDVYREFQVEEREAPTDPYYVKATLPPSTQEVSRRCDHKNKLLDPHIRLGMFRIADLLDMFCPGLVVSLIFLARHNQYLGK